MQRLIMTGLARPESIELFVSEVRDVLSRWRDYVNPEEKLINLQTLVGKHSASIAIPPPVVAGEGQRFRLRGTAALAAHENAVFRRSSWAIIIKAARLTANFGGVADSARFANTLFHELRHAEQTFQVARWMASKMKGDAAFVASQLQEEFGVTHPVAQQAAANPLPNPRGREVADRDAAPVKAQWDEVSRWAAELCPRNDGESVAGEVSRELAARQTEYMTRGSHLAKRYVEYSQWDSARQALSTSHVEEAWTAFGHAQDRLKHAFKAYGALAVERDAWHVGGEVERRVNPRAEVHTIESELHHLSGHDPSLQVELSAIVAKWRSHKR